MRTKSASYLVLLLIAALSLSGCVVAAIPLVAGGAIARTATDNQPGPSVEADAPPELVAEAAPSPAVKPMAVSDTSPAADVLAPPAPTQQPITPIRSLQLAEFVRYSIQRTFAFSRGERPIVSAVLRDPAALDGERLSCGPGDAREPAILIDLDPGDEPFAQGAPLPTSSAIALSLKVLRAEGVTVAWISENSAANADIVRDALTQSGLDPKAEDTLLLMRYPDDRKQTRRQEFAAETCLIAIAGDERRDFDELYDYLVNRNAALELEALINNGWFLIGDRPDPTPTLDNPAEEAGAKPEVQGPPALKEEEQDQ